MLMPVKIQHYRASIIIIILDRLFLRMIDGE